MLPVLCITYYIFILSTTLMCLPELHYVVGQIYYLRFTLHSISMARGDDLGVRVYFRLSSPWADFRRTFPSHILRSRHDTMLQAKREGDTESTSILMSPDILAVPAAQAKELKERE